MSTLLANPAVMIKQGAPHVIRSEEELMAYTRALFELTGKSAPIPEEEEAIELLTLLIERYESEHYRVPDADPVDVLKFLLDQNGLSQRDIATELGSESTVSLILSGKRRLNRDHIERLSQRFHLSPSVFFGGGNRLQEETKVYASLRPSIDTWRGSAMEQEPFSRRGVPGAMGHFTHYFGFPPITNPKDFMDVLRKDSPWRKSSIPSEEERPENEHASFAA